MGTLEVGLNPFFNYDMAISHGVECGRLKKKMVLKGSGTIKRCFKYGLVRGICHCGGGL